MVHVPYSLIPTHLALFCTSPTFPQQTEGCHESSKHSSIQSQRNAPSLPASSLSSRPSFPTCSAELSASPSPSSSQRQVPDPHHVLNPNTSPNYNHNHNHKNRDLSSHCAFFVVRPAHLSHRQLYKPCHEREDVQAGVRMKAFSSLCSDQKSHSKLQHPDESHPCPNEEQACLNPNLSPSRAPTRNFTTNNDVEIDWLQKSSSSSSVPVVSNSEVMSSTSHISADNVPSCAPHARRWWWRVQKPANGGLHHSISVQHCRPPTRLKAPPPQQLLSRQHGPMEVGAGAGQITGQELMTNHADNAEVIDVQAAAHEHDDDDHHHEEGGGGLNEDEECINDRSVPPSINIFDQLLNNATNEVGNQGQLERSYKSLESGFSSIEPPQVWYTIIENGLDTRKKTTTRAFTN